MTFFFAYVWEQRKVDIGGFKSETLKTSSNSDLVYSLSDIVDVWWSVTSKVCAKHALIEFMYFFLKHNLFTILTFQCQIQATLMASELNSSVG